MSRVLAQDGFTCSWNSINGYDVAPCYTRYMLSEREVKGKRWRGRQDQMRQLTRASLRSGMRLHRNFGWPSIIENPGACPSGSRRASMSGGHMEQAMVVSAPKDYPGGMVAAASSKVARAMTASTIPPG